MEIPSLRNERKYSAIMQAQVPAEINKPSLGAVVDADVSDAFRGVGTGYADLVNYRVKEADKTGSLLTKDEYEQSELFRDGVYYDGLTREGAIELASFHDEMAERDRIRSRASTGQRAAGLTAAFGLGMFEPKNLAAGVATSYALSPVLGAIAPAASSLRRLIQMKRSSGNYGAKAGIGATEGLVSAAILEPSNRSTAEGLRMDYTMADSLWNIGLSTTLGAGLNTVPSFINEKWKRHGSRTAEIVSSELDLATEQMVRGQRVDVGVVERSQPIKTPEQVSKWVDYKDTPEFKARFEGSKVVDESGAPLMVYHGTTKEFEQFDTTLRKSKQNYGQGAYFAVNAADAGRFATREGANVRPVYLGLRNPFVGTHEQIRAKQELVGKELGRYPEPKDFTEALKREGFDGVAIKRFESDALPDEYVVFAPDQIISAFGADDYETIKARMESENGAAVQKWTQESTDPLNDTALDMNAVQELDAYTQTLDEGEAADLAEFERYNEQIQALDDEQFAGAKQELADALETLNEADIEEAYKSLYSCLTRG